MKKILAALLAVAMLASLAACGGDSSQSSSSSSKDSSSAADDSGKGSSEESTAGGRFDSLATTDEQVSLLIDFHSFTPSVSETPTEESSHRVQFLPADFGLLAGRQAQRYSRVEPRQGHEQQRHHAGMDEHPDERWQYARYPVRLGFFLLHPGMV